MLRKIEGVSRVCVSHSIATIKYRKREGGSYIFSSSPCSLSFGDKLSLAYSRTCHKSGCPSRNRHKQRGRRARRGKEKSGRSRPPLDPLAVRRWAATEEGVRPPDDDDDPGWCRLFAPRPWPCWNDPGGGERRGDRCGRASLSCAVAVSQFVPCTPIVIESEQLS